MTTHLSLLLLQQKAEVLNPQLQICLAAPLLSEVARNDVAYPLCNTVVVAIGDDIRPCYRCATPRPLPDSLCWATGAIRWGVQDHRWGRSGFCLHPATTGSTGTTTVRRALAHFKVIVLIEVERRSGIYLIVQGYVLVGTVQNAEYG